MAELTMNMRSIESLTPTGKTRGFIRDGIRIFRGIRYVERVTPNRQFSESRDPQHAGNASVSIFPQSPKRLTNMMGDVLNDVAPSEDALLLNVRCPGKGRKRSGSGIPSWRRLG
jgi:carboxylesterase type B